MATLVENSCSQSTTLLPYFGLLYSTFINKVIRFGYISYFLSTEVFSFKNKVF